MAEKIEPIYLPLVLRYRGSEQGSEQTRGKHQLNLDRLVPSSPCYFYTLCCVRGLLRKPELRATDLPNYLLFVLTKFLHDMTH